MDQSLDHLENDFERAEYLQNLLVDHATGGSADGAHYQSLRKHFLDLPAVRAFLPDLVRKHRDLGQFWQFIKLKLGTYAARRTFIWEQFGPLLDHLESGHRPPSHESVSQSLTRFDQENVHAVWSKALDRKKTDPEGAITAARTLLETVCKHILDEANIEYDDRKADLPELYRKTATLLHLAPSQHTEDVFKQILGGCTSIVTGLGTLRSRIGDAHGRGKRPVKPAPRHAELAVNLAGALALFLVDTWVGRKGDA
jgi:hypothetical protein